MTQTPTLDTAALKTLFLDARTQNDFTSQPVAPELLKAVYDLARMGPTSANCQPLRTVFLTSAAAKDGLMPALGEGNRAKTLKAPVTALFAMDMEFHHLLPRVFPHTDARAWFEGNQPLIETTAFRNATLQAGYFMLAARALGLDCGPMSGFDPETVNRAYFAEGSHRINFICNLGYGSGEGLFARSPRLEFDEACRVL